MALEKKILIRLPSDLHRKAKIKAAKTDKSMAEVCREALQKWVNENEPGQSGKD